MNKDPAMLFYTGDFLVGTMLMTNEEVGKYIRLLCIAHSKGGYLTKQDMFKICNEDDVDVLSKFLVDEEGVYYNVRLLSEITKRRKYSDSRSNNRKGKKEEDMSIICKSYDVHMENENKDININSISSSKTKKKIKDNNVNVFEEYAKEDTILLTSLKDFETMRKENKKPMSDRAKQLLCTELDKLKESGQDIVACINQSIMRNYQGVFAISTNNFNKKENPKVVNKVFEQWGSIAK
jgi:uncharacterized protein YdaU (DUF1376 family)